MSLFYYRNSALASLHSQRNFSTKANCQKVPAGLVYLQLKAHQLPLFLSAFSLPRPSQNITSSRQWSFLSAFELKSRMISVLETLPVTLNTCLQTSLVSVELDHFTRYNYCIPFFSVIPFLLPDQRKWVLALR